MACPRPFGLLVSAGTLLAALIVPAPASYAAVSDPASLVNPLLGTTNGANDFPGADVPFGMTQWSPDTAARAQGGADQPTVREVSGRSEQQYDGRHPVAELHLQRDRRSAVDAAELIPVTAVRTDRQGSRVSVWPG
jgi:putative alpha-1,2-mannosidase